MRSRLSPSLVVSVVALVLAVGGTAAAGSYLITSTKQIKPSVLKKLEGKRGPRGLQGPQGASAQTVGYRSVIVSKNVPQGTVVTVDATCPAGFVVTGGGVSLGANQLVYAGSVDNRTYEVALGNFSSFPSSDGGAQAFCASGLKTTARAAVRALGPARRSSLIADYLASHRR